MNLTQLVYTKDFERDTFVLGEIYKEFNLRKKNQSTKKKKRKLYFGFATYSQYALLSNLAFKVILEARVLC